MNEPTKIKLWQRRILYPVAVYLLSRLMLFAIFRLMTDSGMNLSWFQWDARHYLNIVANGYTFNNREEAALGDLAFGNLVAFFPLFPMLTKVFATLLHAPMLPVAMGLATCFAVLATVLLYNCLEEEMGQEVATLACPIFVFFPSAVFLSAPYTESLEIYLCLFTFWCLMRDRYGFAMVGAAFAAVSRMPGVFMIIVVAVEMLRTWRQRSKAEFVLAPLMALPFGLFLLFQWRAFGDPFAFLKVQQIGWQRQAALPTTGLVDMFHRATLDVLHLLDLVVFLIVTGVVAVTWRKTPVAWRVFFLGVLASVICVDRTMSVSRQLLAAMPFYPAMGYLLKGRSRTQILVFAVAVVWFAMNALLFLSGKEFY